MVCMGCGKAKESYRTDGPHAVKQASPAAVVRVDAAALEPVAVAVASKPSAAKKVNEAAPAVDVAKKPTVAQAATAPTAKKEPVKEALPAAKVPAPATAQSAAVQPPILPPAAWELREESSLQLEMSRMRRQLDALRRIGSYATALGSHDDFEEDELDHESGASRRDLAHPLRSKRQTAEVEEVASPSVGSSDGSYGSWLVLGMGMCATAFGGVLTGWGWYTTRPDLWNIGAPVLIAGQCVVLLGIVLELDALRKRRSDSQTIDANRYEDSVAEEAPRTRMTRDNGQRLRGDGRDHDGVASSHLRTSSVRAPGSRRR